MTERTSSLAQPAMFPHQDRVLTWLRSIEQTTPESSSVLQGIESAARAEAQGVGVMGTLVKENPKMLTAIIAQAAKDWMGKTISEGRENPVVRAPDGRVDIHQTIAAQAQAQPRGKPIADYTAAEVGEAIWNLKDMVAPASKGVFAAALPIIRKQLIKDAPHGTMAKEFFKSEMQRLKHAFDNDARIQSGSQPLTAEELFQANQDWEFWKGPWGSAARGHHTMPQEEHYDKQMIIIQQWLDHLDNADPMERARIDQAIADGYTIPAFHGGKGDIKEFDPNRLGETTEAISANLGFFSASTPATAGYYGQYANAEKARKEFFDALDKKAVRAEQAAQKIASKYPSEQGRRSLWEDIEDRIQQLVERPYMLDKDPEELANIAASPASHLWWDPDDKIRQRDFEKIKNHFIEAWGARSEQHEALENIEYFANTMPVMLRMKKPLVIDMQAEAYRETKYTDLVTDARNQGYDGLIMKNTRDGHVELTNVYVVFDPAQVRSKFAKFDPKKSPKTVQIGYEENTLKQLKTQIYPMLHALDSKMFPTADIIDDMAKDRGVSGAIMEIEDGLHELAMNQIKKAPSWDDKTAIDRARLLLSKIVTEHKNQTPGIATEGTGNVIANVALPLGLGAAAAAHSANQESNRAD